MARPGGALNRSVLYSAIFSGVVLLLAGGAAMIPSFPGPFTVAIALAVVAVVLGVRVLLTRRAARVAKVVAGIVSVLAATLAILLVIDLFLILTLFSCTVAQPGSLGKVESETGLPFPPEAILVRFSSLRSFLDPIWAAKVVIPAASYDDFRQALAQKPPDDDDSLVEKAGRWASWWKPTDVVMTKQYLINSQVIVVVVVSKEGDDYAIYIERIVF